jgi:serine protease SohB
LFPSSIGLAAAQLLRLKQAGLHVTVSVDEVAASGGYLMACVADKIVASPFAIIGSIGVVATIPNFADRLTREGVVVEEVTAGKFKRTLTPYKKPSEEDRAKMKSDIEDVLILFKSFLTTNRPQLNIDKLATGEIWHGPDALSRGLIDELSTTDDILMQYRNSGYEIYALTIKPVIPRWGDLNDDGVAAESGGSGGAIAAFVSQWFYRIVLNAIREVVSGGSNQFVSTFDWKNLANNNNSYDGKEFLVPGSSNNNDNETPVNHRILAVDTNHQSYPRL